MATIISSIPRHRTTLSFNSVLLLLLAICSISISIFYYGVKNETQTYHRLLSSLTQYTDPKSIVLRSELDETVSNKLQFSNSPNAFFFSAFPSVDDMFVDPRLQETLAHPKDMVIVFVDTTYLETFGVWLDHYKQHDNSGRILSTSPVD